MADNNYDINDLINGFLEKFSLPECCVTMALYVKDPHYTVIDIIELIEQDTYLNDRLLALINSVLYEHQAPVENLSRAITVLGVAEIHYLLVALSVFNLFVQQMTDRPFFLQKSVYCGVLARVLSKKSTALHSENLFLMGFLANIGQLVIAFKYPDVSSNIVKLSHGKVLVEPIIEQEILGFTTADVGSELIKQWGLADSIYDAVAYQFHPKLAQIHYLDAQLVYLSSVLNARLECDEKSIKLLWENISAERKMDLNLNSADLFSMVMKAQIEGKKVFEIFKGA